jgi:hypothetical protein
MRKRSEEQWRALFLQQEASGLSAAEFCNQHDLCPKYFSLRRKQLTTKPDDVKTGFVRVRVKPDTQREVSGSIASSLVIHIPAGKLMFSVLPPPDWLAQLLRTVA